MDGVIKFKLLNVLVLGMLVMIITSCVTVNKLYEGPDKPISEIAILRDFPPCPGRYPYWVDADGHLIRPSGNWESHEYHLLPGRHVITIKTSLKGGEKLTFIAIEGHSYSIWPWGLSSSTVYPNIKLGILDKTVGLWVSKGVEWILSDNISKGDYIDTENRIIPCYRPR